MAANSFNLQPVSQGAPAMFYRARDEKRCDLCSDPAIRVDLGIWLCGQCELVPSANSTNW